MYQDCTRLYQLIRSTWAPRTDASSFIEWDSRELNTLAEHAANVPLDLRQDWSRGNVRVVRKAIRQRMIFRVCAYGARRSRETTAAGVVIIAYEIKVGCAEVLYRRGKLLAPLASAFLAELLALEGASEVIMKAVDAYAPGGGA